MLPSPLFSCAFPSPPSKLLAHNQRPTLCLSFAALTRVASVADGERSNCNCEAVRFGKGGREREREGEEREGKPCFTCALSHAVLIRLSVY